MIVPDPELIRRAARAMMHAEEPYSHMLNIADIEADEPAHWARMVSLAEAAVTRYLNPTLPIPDEWETLGPPCGRISDPFPEEK